MKLILLSIDFFLYFSDITFKNDDKMLPSRPNIGTLGKRTVIDVNCWDFEVADVLIHRYDIQPEELQLSKDDGCKTVKSGERALRDYIKYITDMYEFITCTRGFITNPP